LEDQVITHTIQLDMEIPIGAEFEAHPLYGLSKSQFDALKADSIITLKMTKYSLTAIIGLFLPDAFEAFHADKINWQPWMDKASFAIWIAVVALILEILFILLCRIFPVTEKYKTIKEISDHFKKNRAKRARSK